MIKLMFCFHRYGKVEADGFQYCLKCGKANHLPCPHMFEEYDRFNIEDTNYNYWYWQRAYGTSSIIIISKCKKCGIMRQDTISANEY